MAAYSSVRCGVVVREFPRVVVPPVVAAGPPAGRLAGGGDDGYHGAVLTKVMNNCILLREVVEVNAHREVEVTTCTKVPPDNDGDGPALHAADLHDVRAIKLDRSRWR